LARWPLVNLVHTLLSPLLFTWRRKRGGGGDAAGAGRASRPHAGAHARRLGAGDARRCLQQTNPAVSELYRQRKLWESLPAEAAAAELRETLSATLDRQRAAALATASRGGPIAAATRWLLTIGAVIWFPIVQPVLEIFLQDGPEKCCGIQRC